MRRPAEVLSQAAEIQNHGKGALPGVGGPLKTLHRITENELEDLARGASSRAIYFNWALTLLSTATACLISLLTTTMSPAVFVAFVAIAAGGYGVALPFLLFWYKERKSSSELLTQIRMRLNMEHPLHLRKQSETDPNARQRVVKRIDDLRERLFLKYGEMPDSVELLRADRNR